MGTYKLPIDQNLLEKIEAFAGVGLTLKDISLLLGINESTFHDYKNKFPEVEQAVHRGKLKGKQAVGQALYRKALTGDVTAAKWIEATRYGYSEKIRTENETTLKVESFEDYLQRMKDGRTEREVSEEAQSISDSRSDTCDSIGSVSEDSVPSKSEDHST